MVRYPEDDQGGEAGAAVGLDRPNRFLDVLEGLAVSGAEAGHGFVVSASVEQARGQSPLGLEHVEAGALDGDSVPSVVALQI